MAKFGFEYKAEAESAENQGGGGFELLPEMYAVLEATAAEIADTSDNQGKQVKMVFDVLEPEQFKGRKIWAYWTIRHEDPAKLKNKYNGKPKFDCFCMSVDVPEPEDTDDLLFKQFVAKIGISKGGDKKDKATGAVIGKYNDKNQLDEFFFPSAPENYPEIGVIAGGATGAPANDNRPAANTNTRTAAPATKKPGETPWQAAARKRAEEAAAKAA